MKARVQRRGLLGLTMHHPGEILDLQPGQFRPTWMEPLDDEAKAEAAKSAKKVKAKRVALLKRQKESLELTIKKMEAEQESPKKARGSSTIQI